MHKEVHVPHGVILVLEDYLFMDQYNGDDEQLNNQHELDDDIEFSASSNVPVASSLPKVVGGEEDHTGGDFPMIEMGTHDRYRFANWSNFFFTHLIWNIQPDNFRIGTCVVK